MNRLQLVNALSVEASIAGNGVSTTNGQTGEGGRLVSWIDQAYEDVQNEYFDWKFLRAQATFNTQVGVNIIQPAADLNVWDREMLFNSDRSQIQITDYEDLEEKRDESITGTPTEFILKADNTLMAYPKPDKVETFTYDYFKVPHVMTADTDKPVFPAQFHRVIIGRALIYYGNYESAQEMIMQGTQIYQTLLKRLAANQAGGQRRYYGLSDASNIQIVAQ